MSARPRPSATRTAQLAAALWLLGAAAACSDGPVGPEARTEPTADHAVRWNEVARGLVVANASSPPHASRVYAYSSLASWVAWKAAGAAPVNGVAPSRSAAAAQAAASVLSHFFPGAASYVNAELEGQALARAGRGETPASRTAGEDIGAAVAERAIARALADGADAVWDNVFPVGDGYYTGRTPAVPVWGTVRPWLVASGSAMRAPPPPPFASEAFQTALSEVRQISDSRTPQQLAIALHWADGAGTVTPAGHWNVIAADLIRRYDASESEALRAFALSNIAMADAMIGCWDSKFAYWYLRPWEADPAITTPVGKPNHPSYPSGHSCGSAAAATVLGGLFPREAASLNAMADEASTSRLYGGIHYKFDLTAGLAIGRDCGALALSANAGEAHFLATLGWAP
ncbi:MAG TPA: vanadium-dependent haloperoxidase [Gemmatimonadaceae bacterium]|nr:vanadium-dependent haloperoxidase [Gemmatimonadaceae bacterium]